MPNMCNVRAEDEGDLFSQTILITRAWDTTNTDGPYTYPKPLHRLICLQPCVVFVQRLICVPAMKESVDMKFNDKGAIYFRYIVYMFFYSHCGPKLNQIAE